MIKTPVCQIVGYKNSGKTTFMNKLINYYTLCGIRVGALKHHGHGGEPNEPAFSQGTDSEKHWKAGADISGVQGESILQLSLKPKNPLQLEEILAIYDIIKPDIILVEGYKYASFPKVVLLNDLENDQLLTKVTNPIAIGSQNKELLHNQDLFTIPLLEVDNHISEIAAYIQKRVM